MAKKPKTVLTPASMDPTPQTAAQVEIAAAPVPEHVAAEQVAPLAAPVEPVIKDSVQVATPSNILATDIGTTVVVEDQRSPAFRSIEARLKAYVEAMAPNVPMDERSGANRQLELRSTLLSVFKLPIIEFTAAMDMVLDTFRRHANGAFNRAYLFRYMDNIQLNGQLELDTFTGLLHLYTMACNPATRQAIASRVDLRKIATGMSDEDGQLLLAYFSR